MTEKTMEKLRRILDLTNGVGSLIGYAQIADIVGEAEAKFGREAGLSDVEEAATEFMGSAKLLRADLCTFLRVCHTRLEEAEDQHE